MRNVLFIVIATLLLGACTQLATQPPPPTPQVLEVAVTPAMRSWEASLRACAATLPELRLLVEETPASRLDLEVGISIRLGTPDTSAPYFAAQIGEDQIVVVVHPDNPIQTLTGDALRSLYTGQTTTWDSLVPGFTQPVQVWDYPAQNELHSIFLLSLWKTNPPLILAYQAPDPAAMLEAIAENPGAVGYLPSSWLKDSPVSLVPVDSAVKEALRQPVLLLSAQPPQGLARSLLGCLQGNQK